MANTTVPIQKHLVQTHNDHSDFQSYLQTYMKVKASVELLPDSMARDFSFGDADSAPSQSPLHGSFCEPIQDQHYNVQPRLHAAPIPVTSFPLANQSLKCNNINNAEVRQSLIHSLSRRIQSCGLIFFFNRFWISPYFSYLEVGGAFPVSKEHSSHCFYKTSRHLVTPYLKAS